MHFLSLIWHRVAGGPGPPSPQIIRGMLDKVVGQRRLMDAAEEDVQKVTWRQKTHCGKT